MQSKPEQSDAILWGGYGWGNTGDEICLAAALERLRQTGTVAVLSHKPEYTSSLFPGAKVLPYLPASRRFSKRCKNFALNLAAALSSSTRNRTGRGFRSHFQPDWARQLSRARRLYLCGGGYLTDRFSLDFFLPPIRQAARMQLPIESAPIGIGPFKSSRNAETVARALAHADLKVRDEESLAFCRAHGLRAALEPDDAFAWARAISLAPAIEPAAPRPRKIGVCLFSQYGEEANFDLTGWWTDCLCRLQAQHPEAEIEGFSFHASPQYEFREMVRIFGKAGLPLRNVLPPEMDFRKAADAVRSYDFIISTRFHATILANVFQIPNVAIAAGDYYLSKMKAAIRGNENSSWLVNPAQQPPDAVPDICQRAFAARAKSNGAPGDMPGDMPGLSPAGFSRPGKGEP